MNLLFRTSFVCFFFIFVFSEEVHWALVPEYYGSAGFPIMEAHLYSFSASNYVFCSNWNKIQQCLTFCYLHPHTDTVGWDSIWQFFQMFLHNYLCLFSFSCFPLWEWLTTMFTGRMLYRKDPTNNVNATLLVY